jgi:hypothetical protein
MTRSRKLKKAIRARAAKTGESYTAARHQLLKSRTRPAAVAAAAPPPLGLSDRAVRAKTGHGYDHWFPLLDAFGAAAKGHTATARHLSADHGVPAWHAQGITVAYERARGLRVVNQAASGFQVTVSKVVHAELDEVLTAFFPAARKRWLASADPGLRRALSSALAPGAKGVVRGPKRARVRYKWEGTDVELMMEPRVRGTSVSASSTKLEDAAQVALRRRQWKAALEALQAHLGR